MRVMYGLQDVYSDGEGCGGNRSMHLMILMTCDDDDTERPDGGEAIAVKLMILMDVTSEGRGWWWCWR